ncbi:MAG: AAA family ATPase [Burkholderiaceae bacterium]
MPERPSATRWPASPDGRERVRTSLTTAFVDALIEMHLRAAGCADRLDLLRSALTALLEAVDEGQVGLSLTETFENTGLRERIETQLRASPLLDIDGLGERPLVLEHGHLYRRQDWAAEQALAAGLGAIARAGREFCAVPVAGHDGWSPTAADGEPARADESTAHAAIATILEGLNRQQRDAVAAIRRGSLLVLSGGPGTGKTHTLAALVRTMLIARRGARVVVAAPTGKAAVRLAEGLAGLGDRASVQVSTVHRLLGYSTDGRYLRNALQPIDADLVVVDECSMLDSRTAARLVEALAPNARLVLAGDRDQLASVQAGAFFGALCQSRHPALAAARVLLEENFRQREAPALTRFANAISRGLDPGSDDDAGPALQRVEPPDGARDDAGRWRPALIEILVADALRSYRPLVGMAADARDAQGAHEALRRFAAIRVLSTLRAGPAGAAALNQRIVRALFGSRAEATPGRLLIIRRNHPALDLYNGDIGMVWATGHGPVEVMFESGRSEPLARLPLWEDGFALTIHQAQGSEFDRVLLLPAPAGHPMATREALYTGATRARRALTVYADRTSLRAAAASPGRHQLSLLARLDT